jgi:hypothetical protein
MVWRWYELKLENHKVRYIKKQMQVKGLLKEYTLPSLLDKLDVIECFEQPGRSLRVGEMVEKQENLYHALEVKPPASL